MDRYELLGRIGEGGTAEVFRARDMRLERIVAIKLLRQQFSQDPQMRSRFSVEARAAAGLSAAHVVPVYDFGTTEDGALFIVMPLIEGRSLRESLRDHGRLAPEEAARIGRQVAVALAAAHARNLVHRDVKPGNVLLDRADQAHLTDFGIVKALSDRAEITQVGVAFGTAAYLSPEQATGDPVGPAADLYALGTVLYEMLAGHPPFTGEDAASIGYRQAWERPRPLSEIVPGVDRDLEALVMECLEKDPADRPGSAGEVADRLAVLEERLRATGRGAPLVLASAAADATVPLGRAAWAPAAAIGSGAAAQPFSGAGPAFAQPDSTAAYRPGVVRGVRPHQRDDRSKRRGLLGPLLLGSLFALILIAFAAFGLGGIPFLGGGDATDAPTGPGGAAIIDSSPTPGPTAVPITRSPDTAPPVTALPTPQLITAPPTAPPTVEPTAVPTVEPTSRRTREPKPTREPSTPEPTLDRTPRPTREPPPPTPTPPTPPTPTPPPTPPPTETATVSLPSQLFEGGFERGNGRYHGRTVAYVYGQGTDYNTMTAVFQAAGGGSAQGTATLSFVGIDDEAPEKNPMRITLNGQVIFSGADPLPNDFCCGSDGPGNWGTATFRFPAILLRGRNTLSITNLDPGDCTYCPNFIMIDTGELTYRRPG